MYRRGHVWALISSLFLECFAASWITPLCFSAAWMTPLCFLAAWMTPLRAAAGAPADPTAAQSDWWHEANPQITVHEHSFYRVTLNNIGCELRVRLYVDAPFERYRDADEAKNHYRFRALLKLAGGHSISSPEFSNDAPGLRVFAFTHDSNDAGCWAKEPRKLRKLDVNACRGKGCSVDAFK
jgi:hypothetical protein